MIPSTAAHFVHDPLKPWRRPPSDALRGRSVIWHTLWSETYSNPRYAELVPRLRDLFFAPIRQRPGLLGRIDGRVARATRFLERRTLQWYRHAGVRVLLTPSPWQAGLFSGPVVVDLDDPAHTPSERAALSTPNIRNVIVTTDAIADYVQEANPGVDVLVIPQGVDLARAIRANYAKIREQLLARSSLPAETVIVGYHAPIICLSTEPEYRGDAFRHFHIDALLQSVQRLWSDDLPFLTVLLGNSSTAIRSVARSERRLVLKEYVDREHLFDWVGAFDIGAYPRTVDFHGRQSVKLLEYMAAGAATVAMSTSETTFLEENSLGYTAADPDRFHSSLRRLIVDHDARRALGLRSRNFVQAHDWDALAVRYDDVLASAAEPA